jgi:hypothetical protein
MFSVALNVYRSTLRRRALPSVPLDAVAELVGPAATHLALEDAQREDLVGAPSPGFRRATVTRSPSSTSGT